MKSVNKGLLSYLFKGSAQLSDLVFCEYFQVIALIKQPAIRLSGMFLAGIQSQSLFKVSWIPGQARKDFGGTAIFCRTYNILN